MTKITFISDTHGKHWHMWDDLNRIITSNNDNDITMIIHAGDCTNVGKPNELTDFLEWFSSLPYKHKVFIAGNHDFCFEDTRRSPAEPINYPDIPDEFKEKGVIYLMDKMVEVDGFKIYGSPWQPRFFDWAFNVDRHAAIAKKWEPIPEGLDILITHGPVYGILDATYTNMRVGCEELYKRVMQVRPYVHVCGHIHYSYGYKEYDGINFINASSLGENYKYINKPITLVFDENKKIEDVIVAK